MKGYKKILIGLMTLGAVAALAAGCGEPTKDAFIKDNELTSTVTYLPNGGNIEDMAQALRIYYKADSPVIDLGNTVTTGAATSNVERSGYVFDGWYFAELADGMPVFLNGEEEVPATKFDVVAMAGAVKLTDEKVDFSVHIGANETWYVGAKWVKDAELEYRLGGTEPITVADASAPGGVRVIQPGEQLKSPESFGVAGSIHLNLSKPPIESTDSTFSGEMFLDAACTQPSGGSVAKPADGSNAVVYAKYIPGLWTLVKTDNDVRKMFAIGGVNDPANRYYIYNDITMPEGGTTIAPCSTFNATVQGNGHTITGIAFGQGNAYSAGANVGTFGRIGASASITGLTLKDVTVTYKVRTGNVHLYGFALATDANATFSDFKIEGLTMNVEFSDPSVIISNIPKTGDTYASAHWLFGGDDAYTDEMFLNGHAEGFTLTGQHLNINDIAVV